jgi:hypothetical protein
MGAAMVVTGQTPGNFINIQMAVRNSHNTFTGNYTYKKLIAQPV